MHRDSDTTLVTVPMAAQDNDDVPFRNREFQVTYIDASHGNAGQPVPSAPPIPCLPQAHQQNVSLISLALEYIVLLVGSSIPLYPEH